MLNYEFGLVTSDFGKPEKIDLIVDAMKAAHGIIRAQQYNAALRTPVDARSGSAPTRIPATLVSPQRHRLVQNATTTHVLSVVLAAMVICMSLASWSMSTKYVLPKNPCSIAAMISLLAYSNLFADDDLMQALEDRFRRRNGGTSKVLEHARFQMGWFDAKTGQQRVFTINVLRDPETRQHRSDSSVSLDFLIPPLNTGQSFASPYQLTSRRSETWRLNMSSILDTGAYSDFEIQCEGHIFKAHKAILTCASPFFRAAIHSPMKEGVEGKIEFPDDEAELIARALIFIYSSIYESEDISNGQAGPIAQFCHVEDKYAEAIEKWNVDSEMAIKMYSLGTRFFIPDLKEMARGIFLGAIYNNRTGDAETLSEQISEDATLKDNKIVRLVYSMTEKDDWSLRDIMVRYTLGYIEDCNMLCSEAFQQTLRDVPEYAIDIAGSRLSNDYELCKICDEKMFERQWRCKCGKITNCSDRDCAALRTKRSMCVWCSRFGVVEYTPLVLEPFTGGSDSRGPVVVVEGGSGSPTSS